MQINSNYKSFEIDSIKYYYCEAEASQIDTLMMLEESCFDPIFRNSRINFKRAIISPKATIIILMNSTFHPIGYVEFVRQPLHKRMHINSICILESYRRNNLADMLLILAERNAIENNLDEIRLEVYSENRIAKALYESLDYKEVYRYKDYYRDGMDALKMIKTLDDPIQSHEE